jgi:hypothetical protein
MPLSPPDLQTLPAPHSKSVLHGTGATPPQTPLWQAWQFGQSANVVQAMTHLFWQGMPATTAHVSPALQPPLAVQTACTGTQAPPVQVSQVLQSVAPTQAA